MGTYLEQFLESVSTLPAELNRSLTLMRELDERAQSIQDTLGMSTQKYLQMVKKKGSKSRGTAEDEALLGEIKTLQREALEFSDEKLALAQQTYELVDAHIRRLDSDLRKFEAELQSDGTEKSKKRSRSESSSGAGGSGRGLRAASGQKMSRLRYLDRTAEDKRAFSALPGMHDLPIDPAEPLYCYCKRVSYGEMIACDNQQCPFEWFHLDCVNLTPATKPKGKWFCPTCRDKRR